MFLVLFLFVVTLSAGAKSSDGISSLVETVILPPDLQMKPFSDLEMAHLVDTLKNKRESFRQSRSSNYLEELSERELLDQLTTQPERDRFLFLGFLSNGPTIVNLLGQVMILSSIKDFSLIKRFSNSPIKYLLSPQSFRFSLVQIVNEFYSTFLVAHSNTDRAVLQLNQIPGYVKTVLKLLSSASSSLLQSFLPTTLRNIDRVGSQSSILLLDTFNKFSDLIFIIDELIEVTQINQQEKDFQTFDNVTSVDDDCLKEVGNTSKSLFSFRNDQSSSNKEKAEETLEQLKKAEQRYKTVYLQILNFNKKRSEDVIHISSWDISEGYLNDINSILIEIRKLLKEMKCHWRELSRFFDQFNNQTKLTIEVSLKNFLNSIKESNQLRPSIPSFDTDYFKEDILTIHSESELLSFISQSYFNISKNFLFNPIEGLSKLTTAYTPQQRIELNNDLQVQIKKVQSAIRSIIEQSHEEYLKSTRNRQNQLKQFIENAQLELLGAILG